VRQQLKMEGRSAMSLASFYEHYLMCTAGFGQTYADSFIDIFSIADMIHKLCKYVNHYICPFFSMKLLLSVAYFDPLLITNFFITTTYNAQG